MRLVGSLLSLIVAALLLLLTVPARASLPWNLQGIRSVDIVIEELNKDAQDLGITQRMLQDQVFVALRGKAPSLKYDHTAATNLYVNLTLISQGYSFAAFLSLELHRSVDLRVGEDRTDQTPTKRVFAVATVWQDGVLFTGSRAEASTRVEGELDRLLEAFLADYYRGNP